MSILIAQNTVTSKDGTVIAYSQVGLSATENLDQAKRWRRCFYRILRW
jgi:hypothetical protein